jgi:NAD(P)-dependent dehydrogenase (short-subunit alcohol dehydrogenase family)
MPDIALVQGASRGLGLAFVKCLIEQSVFSKVIATCRDPNSAVALQEFAESNSEKVTLLRLDVTDIDSLEAVAETVSASGKSIDLLINCAGVLHSLEGLRPEKRLQDVSVDNLEEYFRINTIGPLMVIKHLVPLMTKRRRAIIANLSARVGSIGDNRLGGWYGYRASKSAQNMMTKTLSIELKRTHPEMICVGLHPGTVATELSAPFSSRVDPEKLFLPEEAATKLLAVMENLKPEETGKVFAHDGTEVPW